MHATWVVLLVLLVVVGSAGLMAVVSPTPRAPTSSVASPTAAVLSPAATPLTHGDLVVGPGQTYTIQPTLGGHTYYQGGNITVEHGGTLNVENVTLSFVQYVGDVGTAQQRLSHLYQFDDNGTVSFFNSTLTTDVQVINAYAKLNLTVTGVLNAWDSTFAFPGWFYIDGSAAVVTLNQSVVTWNPFVATLSELSAIYGDTLWAPTITVLGGGQLNLFASQVDNTYADNTITYGFARPTPLLNAVLTHIPDGTGVREPVSGPGDSANLTLDWSYPEAAALAGYVSVSYNNGNTTTSAYAAVSAWYGGVQYDLGSIVIANNSQGSSDFPFSPALLAAITNAGLLQYLNYTGAFDTPNQIQVAVDVGQGALKAAINVTEAGFTLNTTGPSYDDSVTGAGSRLSAVDTSLDFSWQLPSAGPYSQTPVYPWNSQKLTFTDGAVGYLANITTSDPIPGVFSASAIVPDGSSQVFLYRWAQFNLTGRDGLLAVENAPVVAYYAYNSNQSNNQTAKSLNDLKTANPAIWGYLQYWDSLRGVTTYGVSNALGEAFLLLAAGNLTGPSLPDGIFLGGYHIGISVPAISVGSHWFNWSLSPYPEGVANGTGHYGAPDFGPAQQFNGYFGAMSFGTPVVTANGTANATVRIGQKLGFWVTAVDAGTATITQVGGTAWYNLSGTGVPVATFSMTGLDLTSVGQEFAFNLTWVINDTTTGLNGTFSHPFLVALEWNNGDPAAGGGLSVADVEVTIAPSQITLASEGTTAPTTLNLADQYFTTGVVHYNGTKPATIELIATPTSGGGSPVILGVANALPGAHFTITWSYPLSQYLSPGTSYYLTINATYNHNTVLYQFPLTYSVPATTSPAKNFWTQTIFGLPLWVWLAIAAAIVAGLLVFLLFARRTAAGKLVECGECGNLIPEDATVCPKCGAEFEADLIRCSRCASTIPADSKVCPECAAQLLGKPGEGEAEPERQGYADYTEKYRAEAKRELGENYSEGAFWDWWKRQPTYTSFSQWKLQQSQGTPRSGMSAPPAVTEMAPEAPGQPPKGGGGGLPTAGTAAAAAASAPPAMAGGMTAPPSAAPAPVAGVLKPCPNCGKEIPPEYLVCPFCGAVTQ
jgi:RNA polymerase subunit RPABC4/transcription elongation factor Spt4